MKRKIPVSELELGLRVTDPVSKGVQRILSELRRDPDITFRDAASRVLGEVTTPHLRMIAERMMFDVAISDRMAEVRTREGLWGDVRR